jgi:hypothetical protein
MAQVLPAFYDSFTRGRKDELDFQNIIEAQKQAKLMNPLEVQGKQLNNAYMGEIGTNMRYGNQVRGANLPYETTADRTKYQAQNAKNLIDYGYGTSTLDEAEEVRAEASDPRTGNLNARLVLGTSDQFQQQGLNPPSQYNAGQSALDAWMKANGFGVDAPQTSAPPPPSGGIAPITDIPNIYGYAAPTNGQLDMGMVERANRYGTFAPENLTPEFVTQKIVERGLDPTIAQRMIEVDQARGLPLGTTAAIALAESGFNPNATSPKGARGLMQIMPGNFDMYGGPMFDPENQQASVGVADKLLAERQRKYPTYNIDQLLRAYNGRMDLDLTKVGDPKKRQENLEYPTKVRDAYQQLFGFVGF